MSSNLETKKILYENAARGVQVQLDRKKEIDSKTFNMLSVILIILGLVIEFIDIKEIIIINEIFNVYNLLICIFMFLIYLIIIVLSIIIIIRYICILNGKTYRTINPDMYIDVGENNKNEIEILDDFLKELVKSEKNNAEVNEKQMKAFNSNGALMIIVVIMSIVLNVLFNIFIPVSI